MEHHPFSIELPQRDLDDLRDRLGSTRWPNERYLVHGGDWGSAVAQDERDVGEGDLLPYPPEYPKMPGEPLRVEPSRAKTGRRRTTPARDEIGRDQNPHGRLPGCLRQG
jgi:hypothetical protein